MILMGCAVTPALAQTVQPNSSQPGNFPLPEGSGKLLVQEACISCHDLRRVVNSNYTVLAGQERVIACDRWATAAENIRAIGLSIEALRGMERWGAADIVTRAFQGFHALPESTGASVSTHGWRSTFREVAKSYDGDWIPRARALELIRAQYRREMHVVHPDKGGSTDRAAALNAAMNDAEGELLEPHTKETSSVE